MGCNLLAPRPRDILPPTSRRDPLGDAEPRAVVHGDRFQLREEAWLLHTLKQHVHLAAGEDSNVGFAAEREQRLASLRRAASSNVGRDSIGAS
ncbi:hypothetical protein NS277_13480 [Novosphingobium barchaimii]|nr:hypothetical protein NS277_13480 [Novosphingobium barchaimii]